VRRFRPLANNRLQTAVTSNTVQVLWPETRDTLDFPGKRLFQQSQISCQIWLGVLRIGEKMNVFGHENKRDRINPFRLTGRINMSRQSSSPVVIGQQSPALKARECELVLVTRYMIVLDSFSMWHLFARRINLKRNMPTTTAPPSEAESGKIYPPGQTLTRSMAIRLIDERQCHPAVLTECVCVALVFLRLTYN